MKPFLGQRFFPEKRGAVKGKRCSGLMRDIWEGWIVGVSGAGGLLGGGGFCVEVADDFCVEIGLGICVCVCVFFLFWFLV